MHAAVARRAVLAVALSGLHLSPVARSSAAVVDAPEITRRVRLGIVVGDAPQQFLTIGLFGDAAPSSVAAFLGLSAGTLAVAPGVTYAGSAVTKIVREGSYIVAGRPAGGDATNVQRSIDSTGYVRSEVVSKAERFVSADNNALSHDRPGLVSMRRGGGDFEFVLTAGANPALDAERVVIGEVLEGRALLDELVALPVRRPSAERDNLGLASLYALKAGVGLTVVGAVGRTPLADSSNYGPQVRYGLLGGRFGLGLLAAAFVGGDDPRVRSRELEYRPLTRVRIRSATVL